MSNFTKQTSTKAEVEINDASITKSRVEALFVILSNEINKPVKPLRHKKMFEAME